MTQIRPILRPLLLLWAAVLLLGLLLPHTGSTAAGHTYAAQEQAVVGYYAGWAAYRGYTPDQLPAQELTHINYAFAMIDTRPRTGKISPRSGTSGRRGPT